MRSKAPIICAVVVASFLGGAASHWAFTSLFRADPAVAAGSGEKPEVRIIDSVRPPSYANAFRANGTAEEAILDFGINLVQEQPGGGKPVIQFEVYDRIILNYYSTKRLAITLGEIVRKHEADFGPLELDATKRRKAIR